jgi:hypothetical protein
MKKLLLAGIATAMMLTACKRSVTLYSAANRYTGKVIEIGGRTWLNYGAGDTVIVDETNFIDMDDENGTQYIIVKATGTIK